MVKPTYDGIHLQLTDVDKSLNTTDMYTVNTVDDVFVDEYKNPLTMYLPTIDNNIDNPTKSSPMIAIGLGEDDLSDNELSAIESI